MSGRAHPAVGSATRTVAHFVDSEAWGGSERSLVHVLAGLDRSRWRSVLYHPDDGRDTPLLAHARDLGVELRPMRRIRGRRAPARVPEFFRELRARRPDVFHAHLHWPLACRYELVAAALAGVPAVVATAQLFPEIPWHRSLQLRALVAPRVDRYIAVSEDLARCLRRRLGIPRRKIRVVHNGIPVERFELSPSAVLRADLGAGDRPIVLTTARLDPLKGHVHLLEAAAAIPQAVFALAGEGPQRPALEAQVRERGLEDHVVFLGHRDDVPELLASCDVFVLPSTVEGLPLAVLEAMAAGRPVVATAIGGTDEAVMHGETGILVPPADPAALAAAVRTLISDPQLARRLGEAGRARVRRDFSVERTIEGVTRTYEELLGAVGGR